MKKLLENWRNYQTLTENNESDKLGKSQDRFDALVNRIENRRPDVDAEAYVIKRMAGNSDRIGPGTYLEDVVYAVKSSYWNDPASKESIIKHFKNFVETGEVPDAHRHYLDYIRVKIRANK